MTFPLVPEYQRQAVSETTGAVPHGHLFNLYLALWNDQFSLSSARRGNILARLADGNPWVERMVEALVERQLTVVWAVPDAQRLSLHASSTSPFMTGLGIEHPLENGFSFLNPYGVPYLPGRGNKGVLRRAAQLLRDGAFGEPGQDGWTEETVHVLFGTEDQEVDEQTPRRRGALSFLDVIPVLPRGSMQVEVATPHQTEYLQGQDTPHDSGNPNPIVFLAVPPKSRFVFHVLADTRLMGEALARGERWKQLLQEAFQRAFDWLGFGTKTAVGYGAFVRDEKAEAAAAERRAEAERRRRADRQSEVLRVSLEHMGKVDRQIAEAVMNKKADTKDEIAAYNAVNARVAELTQEELREAAEKLRQMMQQTQSWKESSDAKRPEKNKDYLRTQQVLRWLSGG